MRVVKIMTNEITTSVAESIPSPNTARLPVISPMVIFEKERIAFPMVLIQDARKSTVSLFFVAAKAFYRFAEWQRYGQKIKREMV